MLNKFSILIKKNMRYTIFLFVIMCTSLFGNTESKIDSVNAFPHEYIMSNLDISIQKFSENLIAAKAIGYRKGEAASLALLGMAYTLRGKYDLATSNYIKAAATYEELEMYSELADVYGEFGYFLKRTDMQRANYYMLLAIQIGERYNLRVALAKLYDNYGVLKELEEDLDSAKVYYQKSLDIKEEIRDSVGLPYSLNHLAGIVAREGDLDMALNYMRRSSAIRATLNSEYALVENMVIMGDIFNTVTPKDSALYYYKKALERAADLNHSFMIRYLYKQLSDLYKGLGAYDLAYEYFTKYSAVKDSVLNDEVQTQIEKLKIDFETEKKDRQIAQSELELNRRDFMLYLASGVVLFLVILAYWIYRTQKLKREKIRNELVFQEKLNKANLEKKITNEKLRISRDLHDNIGSQLTFMISSLDNLTYRVKDDKTLDKVSYLGNFGRNTLSDLRNTIWALKQEDAGMEQLVLKINELAVSINNNVESIEVTVNSDNTSDVELSANLMLNIYRIIQEGVQNSIKHSGCSKIHIHLTNDSEKIELILNDNGKGFDENEIIEGSGLENMRSRCERSNGEFSLVSSSEGTEIVCAILIK